MPENASQNKTNMEWIKYVLIGVAVVVGIFAVPAMIQSFHTEDAWWSQYANLTVLTCKNDRCSDYDKGIYKVMYNGRLQTYYDSGQGSKELVSMAYTGISYINDSILSQWGSSHGKSIKKASEAKYVLGFQIFKSDKPITTYGYCLNTNDDKECIAFSQGGTQYRIRP